MADYSKQSNRRKKQAQSNPEHDFVEALFRGIWQLISFIFRRGNKGAAKDDRQARFEQIRDHWQDVELHLMQPETQGLAISEADKALDAALLAFGAAGQTMGERLKASESWFTAAEYNNIWEAHKLRNNLAHELGATVSSEQAKRAVGSMRDALYRLKVLV